MVRQKRKKGFLSRKIPTNVGTLALLIAAIPVVLLANTIIQSSRSQNLQLVEGTSDFNSQAALMQRVGTSSGFQNGNTMPPIFHCPPGAICKPFPSIPFPRVTCIPRPPCLNATPRCVVAELKFGWCPPTNPSISPLPTPPTGCVYRQICATQLKTPCFNGNPNCQGCKPVLVCLSPRPSISGPVPSCEPKPTCNPKMGILCKPARPCFPLISGEPIVSTSPRPSHIPWDNSAENISVPSRVAGSIGNFFKNLFGR